MFMPFIVFGTFYDSIVGINSKQPMKGRVTEHSLQSQHSQNQPTEFFFYCLGYETFSYGTLSWCVTLCWLYDIVLVV